MSELSTRIATALPAAALFLLTAWLGGWIFHGVVALICLVVVHELTNICGKAGVNADPVFGGLFALWILSLPVNPWMAETGLLLVLLFPAVQLVRAESLEIGELIATPFAGLYPSAGLLGLILVRESGTPEGGFALVILLLFMVWGNDIFAYFGGKNLGRRLLAPSISPNKTWEGFLSGFLGSVAGYSLGWWLLPGVPLGWLGLLPAALLVSLAGPLGDLTESRMKRAAGVKDSSSLMPGHGGIMDRFDALLMAAPAFYLYLFALARAGYLIL